MVTSGGDGHQKDVTNNDKLIDTSETETTEKHRQPQDRSSANDSAANPRNSAANPVPSPPNKPTSLGPTESGVHSPRHQGRDSSETTTTTMQNSSRTAQNQGPLSETSTVDKHTTSQSTTIDGPIKTPSSSLQTNAFSLLEEKSIRKEYFCSSCQRELFQTPRIVCEECDDVNLCVVCFSGGFARGAHTPSHKYRVTDNLDYALLSTNWTAMENLLLLDGIEKFGFGNWESAAEMVPGKTPADCESHYTEYYIFGLNGSKTTPAMKERAEKQRVVDKNLRRAAENLPRMPGATLAGYMPLRGDFDVEFNNTAEERVANVAFLDTDTVSIRASKLDVVAGYNRTLEERSKRKKFVHERKLLDIAEVERRESKYPKIERQVRKSLKQFERFMSVEEFEQMVQGILKERQLRMQVALLRKYKQLGLETYEQVREYEQEVEKQAKSLKLKRRMRNEGPSIYAKHHIPKKKKKSIGSPLRAPSAHEETSGSAAGSGEDETAETHIQALVRHGLGQRKSNTTANVVSLSDIGRPTTKEDPLRVGLSGNQASAENIASVMSKILDKPQPQPKTTAVDDEGNNSPNAEAGKATTSEPCKSGDPVVATDAEARMARLLDVSMSELSIAKQWIMAEVKRRGFLSKDNIPLNLTMEQIGGLHTFYCRQGVVDRDPLATINRGDQGTTATKGASLSKLKLPKK